jgi:hypothetical protein
MAILAKAKDQRIVIPKNFIYHLQSNLTQYFCTNTAASPVPFDVFGTDPGTFANQYAEGPSTLLKLGSSCNK